MVFILLRTTTASLTATTEEAREDRGDITTRTGASREATITTVTTTNTTDRTGSGRAGRSTPDPASSGWSAAGARRRTAVFTLIPVAETLHCDHY